MGRVPFSIEDVCKNPILSDGAMVPADRNISKDGLHNTVVPSNGHPAATDKFSTLGTESSIANGDNAVKGTRGIVLQT